MIKKIMNSVLPKAALEHLQRARKQIGNFGILACDYGQWLTIRSWSSVDKVGNPIPWYTYPATEYLLHLDFSRLAVFEYGSGNSTLWWAKRAKSVFSVEDDKDWFEKISNNLASGSIQYLLETNKNSYVSSAPKNVDVFIIDGKHRRECAEHVVKLGVGVMLILDNSDWYPGTVEYLKASLGWFQIDFHGFGPINNYTWTTSVFVNLQRHNELIYSGKLNPKCGLNQVAGGDY
jgi:hypothetical protein